MTMADDLLGPGFKIIDTDTHFTEPADLWAKRAPAKYRDLVPQLKVCDDGVKRWLVNGDEVLAKGGASSVIDKDGDRVRFWDADITAGITADEAHPGAYDAVARLEEMDKQGVFAHIVYPNVAGFGAGRLIRLTDRELALTIVKIYNDAMAEWQEADPGRLFPQALIPFWDIDQAVKEIERCHEMGFVGITMSGEPFNGGLPDLADRHWDPMYEAVTQFKMPINIHIGSGEGHGGPSNYTSKIWPSQDLHRAYVLMCVQLELSNSNFVSNLVTSDLLVRWPETKWVSVESGIGWIPYVLERTDWQLQEALPDDPAMRRPSAKTLFQQSVYATFWFEDSGPRHILEDVGVNNVMFETDFPHPTCLYPGPVEYALERLKHHDQSVIRKVMGENAAKLYGIPT